ncbi:MAG: AraC family ligand binding domain-containing protein, partial [Mycobacteriales bacterium]
MGTSATDLLERHRGGDILPAGRAFGAEVVPVPVSTGPHSHDFCELAIVLAGSGRHGTRHDDVVVARGDAVGVRPCDWHQWHEPVGLTVANVYVDQALLRTGVAPVATNPVLRMFAWPVPALPAPGIARLAAGDLHRVEDAVAALASAGAPDADASRRDADDIADLGHLLVILGIVAAALPVHAAGRAAAAPVDAVRILEEDLAAPWTVAALARAVGLSP